MMKEKFPKKNTKPTLKNSTLKNILDRQIPFTPEQREMFERGLRGMVDNLNKNVKNDKLDK